MLVLNPNVRHSLAGAGSSAAPREFHRRLPGYAPTPLVDLPQIAAELGIGALQLKDESCRFDLEAFKVLGGSWAALRKLDTLVDGGLGEWRDLDDLAQRIRTLGPLELITATEGNHGRGVARTARWLGLQARIFIRRGAAEHRVAAMEAEGATIELVDGTYDDACEVALAAESPNALLIQDTSRPGYEDVPLWVIEGYGTLGLEIDDELARRRAPSPDVVLIQIGVGSLATAVVKHFRRPDYDRPPVVLGVEPSDAACAARSLEQGEPTVVPGPHESMMSGMSCGVLAGVAWPWLRNGLDGVVTIEDGQTERAMRDLHAAGIRAGESGAAGLAALAALLAMPDAARAELGMERDARVLVVSTEGPTDPANWARIVGCDEGEAS